MIHNTFADRIEDMTIQKLRETLQKKVDELKTKYETISENDVVERANILGQINGLLTACILSYGEN